MVPPPQEINDPFAIIADNYPDHCCIFVCTDIWQKLLQMPVVQWLLIILFPLVAVLYYGIESFQFKKYNLRNNGWMKPFVIGFVWGGTVTIYPVLFHAIEHNEAYGITLFGVSLFVKKFYVHHGTVHHVRHKRFCLRL